MPNIITVTFLDETREVFTNPMYSYTVEYKESVVVISDAYGNIHAFPLSNVKKVVDIDPSRQPRYY